MLPVCGAHVSSENGTLAHNEWNMDFVDLIIFLLEFIIQRANFLASL